ncbi:hypothetical protein JOF56_003011 [Kibdelosporangium banguiense]|uniref:Uncharacterized protein n=1 Tax=Kibdelosporangium banguiense TaxID=1365924 RepID=A0ABS4TE46_9PSEU|nr:hypothetical protein [Kibdelosporangium banguiense]MBP2322626.1 hypothetical protein [Kibdelosporangium banguiense]
MGELERRINSGNTWLTQRTANQELAKRSHEVYNATALAVSKIDGMTKVGEHAMERLARLNQDRLALTGHDPVLNALYGQIQMTVAHGLLRTQRRLDQRYDEIW